METDLPSDGFEIAVLSCRSLVLVIANNNKGRFIFDEIFTEESVDVLEETIGESQ